MKRVWICLLPLCLLLASCGTGAVEPEELYLVSAVGLDRTDGGLRVVTEVPRTRENEAFLSAIEKPRAWIHRQQGKWANRNTRAYVRCPYCHTEFALPKGKGKLRATCPHCGQKSEHRV